MPGTDEEEASRESAVDAPASRDWGSEEESGLRVWIALARCYFTFSREVTCKVTEYGLTTPQFGILEALLHLGPLSLGELADKLLVIVQAKLTLEGRRTISEVFPQHASFIGEVVSAQLEPEEQETLRNLLKKLGKGLGSEVEPELEADAAS
jgi:MarR family 2-MHQ and catechol resistance regulon transcriptional repressor